MCHLLFGVAGVDARRVVFRRNTRIDALLAKGRSIQAGFLGAGRLANATDMYEKIPFLTVIHPI